MTSTKIAEGYEPFVLSQGVRVFFSYESSTAVGANMPQSREESEPTIEPQRLLTVPSTVRWEIQCFQKPCSVGTLMVSRAVTKQWLKSGNG